MNDSASSTFPQSDPPHIAVIGDARGASIHDRRVWPQGPPDDLFIAGDQGTGDRRGRGAVHYLTSPLGPAVSRHYRRGGLAARLLGDRYLWQGAERTRPFREFRLLAELHAAGLPVPRPLLARYRRDGLWYRADLVTLRIQPAATLAELLRLSPSIIDWAGLGVTIARFHRVGVWHADLNAHNVLWSGGETAPGWSLIDFDRGRRRRPHADWQQRNLRRLRRSLIKLGAAALVPDFAGTAWARLLAAHASASTG